MLRMALLDRIRGWFYYVFIRGKGKSSEGDLSRLSIIGDIPIRSSPKHSCLGTDRDHLLTRESPEKVGSFYSKTLTLITDKLGKNKHILALLKVCYSSSRSSYSLWVG